jgi:hypothetical protein
LFDRKTARRQVPKNLRLDPGGPLEVMRAKLENVEEKGRYGN